MDDPQDIALEHYLYWRALGLSHDEMVVAIGRRPSWRDQLSSDELLAVLADLAAYLQRRAA